jgi:hypothetical protein
VERHGSPHGGGVWGVDDGAPGSAGDRQTESDRESTKEVWGSLVNSSRFGVLRFQTVHHFLEDSSAVIVALELVEAGTGWGEQDDIA